MQWAILVGRAVLSFGSIERITYQALMQLPTENIFSFVKELSRQRRISLIKQLAKCRGGDCGPLLVVLDEILSAASIRNLIVHNPLMMDIYLDEDSDVSIIPVIRGAKKNQHIGFKEMQQYSDKVERLSVQLDEAYNTYESSLDEF